MPTDIELERQRDLETVIQTNGFVSALCHSLALGYRKGGRVNEQHAQCLSVNLIKASISIGVFCSYTFLNAYFDVFHDFPILTSTFLYLMFFMAPIVYWVGQTIPLMVNFVKADTSSQKAGDALLFSTLGNVAGGIITTLLIMYYFGVSWAIFITVFILTMLSFVVSTKKQTSFFVSVSTLLLVFTVNVYFDSSTFIANNSYANYQTFESPTKDKSYFVSNNSFSSLLNKNDRSGFKYIEQIKQIMMSYGINSPEEKTLVIGAGGFSLTANKDIQSSVHYIDIDKDILELAEKHFLREKMNSKFTGVDARVFLRNSTEKYDFIIVDAYSNKSSIPGSLTTKEFYRSVSSHLKKTGTMISNIVANPFQSDSFSKRISNTIIDSFNSCFKSVVPLKKKSANILFVCSNEQKGNNSQIIYKDNNTKSIVDFFMKNNP